MGMFTKKFAEALGERAVKTFVQAGLGALTAAGVSTIYDVDWRAAAGTALFATLFSVGTSILSGAVTGGDASITKAEVVQPAVELPIEGGEV